MNVSDARELLGVQPVATLSELLEAMDNMVTEAVRLNRIELARSASEAVAAVMVDEGFMEQAQADGFVASMNVKFTSVSAELDQRHANIASLEEDMVKGYARVIDLTEEVRAAEADLADTQAEYDRVFALREEALSQLMTQRYASARRLAKSRMRRRKLLKFVTSRFH